MSVDYATGLSHCDDLGVCGREEIISPPQVVDRQVRELVKLMRQYKGSCVVHVGAGLSTSAGINDFRGGEGVWTQMLKSQQKLEQSPNHHQTKKVKIEPSSDDGAACSGSVEKEKQQDVAAGADKQVGNKRPKKTFDETVPTYSHRALKVLCESGYVKHIVSQNVDGLFLKANLERKFISELHGNFYLDECTKCRSRFIRGTSSPTMRLQRSNVKCPRAELVNCKGYLRDTILDWESPIPYNELRTATRESKLGELHICVGTTLQLKPAMELPTLNKKSKLVIINLQDTHLNNRADIAINYFCDDVFLVLAYELNLKEKIPDYDACQDPTKDLNRIGTMWKK